MKIESKNTSAPTGALYVTALVSLSVVVAAIAFGHALLELVHRWSVQEEYSHGFLIPFIAAWLLWTRRDALRSGMGRPSWIGPALILVAALMHIVGLLSSLFVLSQVGFVIALFGIALGIGGFPLLKAVFVPLVFLLFAIPLPYFVDAQLSWRLQLISSQLGVDFIRLFAIPVYLSGNVIDLGVYQLQVVEACSGLRYLYPLMSLAFLAAYLFQAPIWQRALISLSAIPITIIMNSFRIGVVGVLVDHFGPQDADGFLHMFEGWIIFLACAGLLVAEISLLARFAMGKRFLEVFYAPKLPASQSIEQATHTRAPLVGGFLLLCAVAIAGFLVSARTEILPTRKLFAAFPTTLGQWHGHTDVLDPQTEQVLKLTDYILADYNKTNGHQVNLYVAYYASQRTGASPHSPSVCIPGNGWQITTLERTHYVDKAEGISLPLNRVIIQRGMQKQLVYYWFDERGMNFANEYASKLYLLRDAIFKNRTDGALVRLTTPLYPGEDESAADQRLQQFTRTLLPALTGYLPSDTESKTQQAKTPPHNGQS